MKCNHKNLFQPLIMHSIVNRQRLVGVDQWGEGGGDPGKIICVGCSEYCDEHPIAMETSNCHLCVAITIIGWRRAVISACVITSTFTTMTVDLWPYSSSLVLGLWLQRSTLS